MGSLKKNALLRMGTLHYCPWENHPSAQIAFRVFKKWRETTSCHVYKLDNLEIGCSYCDIQYLYLCCTVGTHSIMSQVELLSAGPCRHGAFSMKRVGGLCNCMFGTKCIVSRGKKHVFLCLELRIEHK